MSLVKPIKTVKKDNKILVIYQNTTTQTYSLVYCKNGDRTELVSSTNDWNYVNYKFNEFCDDLGLNSIDEKDIENFKNNSGIQEIIASYLEDNLKVEIDKRRNYPDGTNMTVDYLYIRLLLNDNMISYDSIMI